jgi:hypothetical protein
VCASVFVCHTAVSGRGGGGAPANERVQRGPTALSNPCRPYIHSKVRREDYVSGLQKGGTGVSFLYVFFGSFDTEVRTVLEGVIFRPLSACLSD